MAAPRAAQYQPAPTQSYCSYVDFAPQLIEPWGVFSHGKYERFDVLVQRANAWLQQHPDVRVNTCESIEVKESMGAQGIVNTDKSSYLERGQGTTYFVRCLRMWIVPRVPSDTSPVQQIGYLNVMPACIEEGGVFSSPKFATFGETLSQLNQLLRTQPLQGKVLTVETQEMKFRSWGGGVQPDESFWREHGNATVCFLIIIRVFYEVGPPAHEQIGCVDFVPARTKYDGVFSTGDFEALAAVVTRAHTWIRQNPGLNITNVQSVDYKLKTDEAGNLDSQRSIFREHGGARATFYVRIVRVAYTQSELLPPRATQTLLSYRTFMPSPLSHGGVFSMAKYEPMSSLMQRVIVWFQHTGAKVLSAETVAIKMYTGHQHSNPEVTYTYNPGKRNEYYVYALRFFLDGLYQDPPAAALPAPPQPQQDDDCCTLL